MSTIEEISEFDTECETRQSEFLAAIETVKECLADEHLVTPPEYIEGVRLAFYLLNAAAEGDQPADYFSDNKLTGVALGQLIMEHTNPDEMANKRLWLEVAEWMGPDYAQGLYHTAVFVTKVV